MPVWKSLSNAFSNLWNKLSNQNANATHTESSKDKSNKQGPLVSPPEDGRQSNLWQSSNEDPKRTNSAQAGAFSRSVSSYSYREEIVHSRGSPVLASKSKPPSTYSPYDSETRTALWLSSHKELAQPSRAATSPAPEISPRLAFSSNCGCRLQTSAASSGSESAQIQRASAADGLRATPRPATSAHLEQKMQPRLVSSRNESAQPKQVLPATTAQVKAMSAMLAEARYLQARAEASTLARVAVDRRHTINTKHPEIRRSLTTSETTVTRRSLMVTERALPSPIQAPRRSSASELVPVSNRIPKSQLQALNKHINSFYVRNLSKCQEMEDEFSGDSSYRNSCLPYKPDQVNTWFREVIKRLPTAEPEGMPHRAYVDMINLIKTSDCLTMLNAVGKFRTLHLEEGEELYFHATDAQSAKSILESGIDLSKSRDREDFSNGYGFYVTTDYRTSVDWATRKGSKFCHSTGAILAFKISRQLQKEQVHLFLEANTAEGKRKWEKTVSHFRNGEAIGALSVLLRNVKFIRGPVSKNAFLRPGEVPVPYDFTQICICDEEYATRYGSLGNICFVIFFKVN